MYIKGIIKIRRDIAPSIFDKTKTEEYRKVTSGIDEGNYLFVDSVDGEIYGTGYLCPSKLWTIDTGKIWDYDNRDGKNPKTGILTYKFVSEHYVSEHDFIQYSISNTRKFEPK